MVSILVRPEEEDLKPVSISTLSLGQGQGPGAEEAIMKAARDGGWVILQNCHLAEAWMQRLANLWEETITQVFIDYHYFNTGIYDTSCVLTLY